jgi:hypothetical protein
MTDPAVRGYGDKVPALLDNVRSDGEPMVLPPDAARLRERVLQHLRDQGFKVHNGVVVAPVEPDKERLRSLHSHAVDVQREQARRALQRYEDRFVERFVRGEDLDPAKIRPRLILIEDRRSLDSLLWRWSALHWSIPVSGGYGRRLRFLVVDEGHGNSVIGLIGLADPVFALACRDQAIGWSAEQRRTRLTCLMDAFVLGALPPYRALCGGKLVALAATSSEVRDAFAAKYGHRTTLIAGRDPDAKLAMITTSSALGRSSVYNRLMSPGGSLAFQPVGYTQGSGDFHLSGEIYSELARFALDRTPDGATYRHERWRGKSFRNRREVIQRALDALGMDSRRMRVHGVRRQVFLAPLAENAPAWLYGEAAELAWRTRSVDELATWWRERWALGRAERVPDWRKFDPADLRLYR